MWLMSWQREETSWSNVWRAKSCWVRWLWREVSLCKGCETVGVVLRVAGSMVSGVLHGSAVMLVLGVFFNPKAFELMPLDKGGVRVEPRVLTEFIFESAGILDDG